MFGGWDSNNVMNNDLFVFDTETREWTQLTTAVSGTSPPASAQSSSTTVQNYLMVFGGLTRWSLDGVQNAYSSGLYVFDHSQLAWFNLTQDASAGDPHLHLTRAGAGLAALDDGRVFLFGGEGSTAGGCLGDLLVLNLRLPLRSAAVYDQSPPSVISGWRRVDNGTSAGAPGSVCSGLTFADAGGKLYLFGGKRPSGEPMGTLFSYDPDGSGWARVTATSGAPPSPRYDHSMAETLGRIYILGGSSGPGAQGVLSDGMFEFDPLRKAWRSWSSAQAVGLNPGPRTAHAQAAYKGVVYVSGGITVVAGVYQDTNDLFSFALADPSSNVPSSTWTAFTGLTQGPNPSARAFHGTVAVGGVLYVFGGSRPQGISHGWLNDLYSFDYSNLQWLNLSSMTTTNAPPARGRYGITSVGSSIFVFGGDGGSGTGLLNDLHEFRTFQSSWRAVIAAGSLNRPTPRKDFGFASLGSRVYVFGGSDRAHEYLNDSYYFDTLSFSWMEITTNLTGPVPPARNSHGFTACGAAMYLFGGFTQTGASSELFAMYPARMTWVDLTGVSTGMSPGPRAGMGLTCQDDFLYVFAGSIGMDTVHLYADLYQFDTFSAQWNDLSSQVLNWPSSRYYHSFCAGMGMLFSFGGLKDTSSGGYAPTDLLGDLTILNAPASVSWPTRGDASGFINVFDWDILVLTNGSSAAENVLDVAINLCSSIFPCALAVDGLSMRTMTRFPGGTIYCSSDMGCTGASVTNVRLTCNENIPPAFPIFEMVGVDFEIRNCEIKSCVGSTTSAIIQSYEGGSISIENCSFQNVSSHAAGGVASMDGSFANIRNTAFVNCSSTSSGGAISISVFRCFGNNIFYASGASINSSTFLNCSSGGSGGAIQISTDSSVVSDENIKVEVFNTLFEGCVADYGGAISVSGSFAALSVSSSTIFFCRAFTAGGGLVASSSALCKLELTSFLWNAAAGFGGGGVFISDSSIYVDDGVAGFNTAPSGGGGMMMAKGLSSAYVNSKAPSFPFLHSHVTSRYSSWH